MKTWITDDNGNRASIEFWGSEAAAREALSKLDRCYDCSDCSGCSGCYDCSGCSGCYSRSGFVGELPPIPVIADIHKSVYAAASQPKCLDMSTWHSSCGTSHCRAGWVVTLAGEAGALLEKKTSTLFAAMQIYKASDPDHPVPPPRFFGSNDDALADMKRMAEIAD